MEGDSDDFGTFVIFIFIFIFMLDVHVLVSVLVVLHVDVDVIVCVVVTGLLYNLHFIDYHTYFSCIIFTSDTAYPGQCRANGKYIAQVANMTNHWDYPEAVRSVLLLGLNVVVQLVVT